MRYLPVRIGGFEEVFPVSSERVSRLRGRLPLYVSLGMHGLLAVLLVPAGARLARKPMPAGNRYQISMVEVAGGSAMAKVPFLTAPKGETRGDARAPVVQRPSVHPVVRKKPVAKVSGSGAQAARPEDRGTNSVAGNGSEARNATFPFPVFSPKPPVRDRALLPVTDQQVVIDVNLNESGEVTKESLVKSVGNALDEIAMTAVKSWRFQPATVEGKAVPSEAEVIFTFGPKYPTTEG
jgi:TonB family protein